MATIAEVLDNTTTDSYAESSKELIEAMKADTSKQYNLVFQKQGLNNELDSLRVAAREAGFSFCKVRNAPEIDVPATVADANVPGSVDAPESVKIKFYLAPLRPSGKKAETAKAGRGAAADPAAA